MNSSTELKNLFEALAKARTKYSASSKDATGRFKFVSYAKMKELCNGPLTENGLCVSQWVETDEKDNYRLVNYLGHSSGEWLSTAITLHIEPLAGQKEIDIKAIGSAITYMRRYTYAGIVGLALDDDEDGDNAAKVSAPNKNVYSKENRSSHENVVGVISNEQLDQLVTEIQKLPQDMRATMVTQIASFNKIRVLSELRQDQFEGVMRSVRSKLK